jgi:hypothetical protein
MFLGLSRSQFRALVSSGRIRRVVVPAEDGWPRRRLLVDIEDLNRLLPSIALGLVPVHPD